MSLKIGVVAESCGISLQGFCYYERDELLGQILETQN
jgi:DNA-binding transcriptional MerR regulator